MLPVDDNPRTLTAGFIVRLELTMSNAPSGRQSTAVGFIIRQEPSVLHLSYCGSGKV